MALTGALVRSYAYEPFGTLRTQTGTVTNPWTFTGRPLEPESGLHFLRNRYYDARSGTFVTQDPIGIAGGINLYAYVRNNPVNLVDLLGLKVEIGTSPVLVDGVVHTFIILTPDDGGPTMTLSGHPGGPLSQFLVATPNMPHEITSTGPRVSVIDPLGRSDARLISDIVQASRLYKNDQYYAPIPNSLSNTYNSNSYVAGVLASTGVPSPPVSGLVPGYSRPVPLPSGVQASSDVGGGAGK